MLGHAVAQPALKPANGILKKCNNFFSIKIFEELLEIT